jgi:hypothetical protein
MQRAANESLQTRQRKKVWCALARARGVPPDELAQNRFRKQLRVGGCRNSRCWLCHGDKLAGRKTLAEKRADAGWREAWQDAG